MGGSQSSKGALQGAGRPAEASAGSTRPVGKNKVQLAVSVLGGVPGATAYHSSVVVNGEEFFFSDVGISSSSSLASHQNPQKPDSVPQVFDMGMSPYTGSQLRSTLERHFQQGTYDLLRKNCNSFSDVSLFYLLHTRMDPKYRSLEQLGQRAPGMLESMTGGQYKPNPKAAEFDIEKLIQDIDPDKVWATPGQATGGTAVDSVEAMRAARLARLGGGGGGGAPGA